MKSWTRRRNWKMAHPGETITVGDGKLVHLRLTKLQSGDAVIEILALEAVGQLMIDKRAVPGFVAALARIAQQQ